MKGVLIIITILLLCSCSLRGPIKVTTQGAVQTEINFDESNNQYEVTKTIRVNAEFSRADFSGVLVESFKKEAVEICDGHENILSIEYQEADSFIIVHGGRMTANSIFPFGKKLIGTVTCQ